MSHKVWGGDCTDCGAAVQGVLLSVMGTDRPRGVAASEHVAQVLQASPHQRSRLPSAGSG